MQNITLHPLWHTLIPIYQHVVGVGTQTLSAIAIYLMATKTPKPGRPFARYLMVLQASMSLVDFNFGILTCPIALFPVPGALCNGIICTVFGASGHAGVVLMQLSSAYVAVAIILCFHFKFTTILEMTKHRKVSPACRRLFQVTLFITFNVIYLLYIPLYRNLEGGAEFTRINFPSMYYLFENPSYRAFVYDPAMYPGYMTLIASTTIFSFCLATAVIIFFVAGSFYLLAQQNTTMSDITRHLQRKMMWLLVTQATIPLNVMLIPLAVGAYSMITMTLTPNIYNVFFCIQLTHASVHTSIVILTTPSYRVPLLFWKSAQQKTAVASFASATRQPNNA